MYVTFRTDTEWSDVAVLPPPTATVGAHYEWRNLMCHRTLPFGAKLVFSIYFEPDLHWHDLVLETNASTLMHDDYAHTVAVSSSLHCALTMEYRAQMGYDEEYRCTLQKITLLAIALAFHEDASSIRQDVMASENHKLVAIISRPTRIYLGRAQQIRTTGYGETRTYTWREGVLGGASDFHHALVEEAADAERIHEYGGPLVSARHLDIAYVPDNDRFSNAHAVLPVALPLGPPVHIQFFNLKTRPAAFGEVHVRGSTFFSHGRPTHANAKKTKKKRRHSFLVRKKSAVEDEEEEDEEYEMHIAMSPHVLVRVYYTMSGEYLRVRRVELEARSYLRSLVALGAEVPPNSV
jgi:hypothetical protein